MKSVTGYGVVNGGKVVVSHRARFDSQVAETFEDGERVAVTVEKSTRSLRQNRMYWWWCNKVAAHFGCDPDYIHAENKRLFNAKVTAKADPHTGAITEESYPGSTADLAVDAFAAFMERVQRAWTEQGVDLPEPNDDEY